MAGGRRIPVTVEADTKGDFDKAADGLDGVAKKGDDADASLRKMSKGAQVLDAEIGKVASSIKDLRAEFEKTGEIDLLKDARKLEGTRKGLERLKKDFGDAGEESGRSFGSRLFETISETGPDFLTKGLKVAAANPELVAVGGAIAIPVVAGLATALSGAALATVAAGGIAGGLVLAAGSPEVHDAWGVFATDGLDQLTAAASVFEEPLARVARTFGDELSRDLPAIRKDFQILAPLVDDLAVGAAGFVHELQPGLTDAFQGAVPVIKELRRALPQLGADIGFFFSQLGSAGSAGADALGLTIDGLGLSVATLGAVLNNGAVAWELFGGGALKASSDLLSTGAAVGGLTGGLLPLLGDLMNDNKGKADNLGFSVDELKRKMDEAGQQQLFNQAMQTAAQIMQDGARAADDLAHQVSTLANTMLADKDAALAFKQGRRDMVEALKASKGSLDDNTEAGLRAQGALISQAQLAIRARDAAYEQAKGHMSVAEAAAYADKVFDEHIAQLYKDAAANSVAKEKVDGVTGALNAVPKANPAVIDLKRQGLEDHDIQKIQNELSATRGTYTANMVVNHITRYTTEGLPIAPRGQLQADFAKGGIVHADTGLITSPGIYRGRGNGMVVAAEGVTGHEGFVPQLGIGRERAAMLLSEMADWHGYGIHDQRNSGYASPVVAASGRGGGPAVVHNTFNIYDATDPDRVVAAIATYERNNGSGWRS